MAARDFEALARTRATRARELALLYPAAREALELLAEIADFQARIDPKDPLLSLPRLIALAAEKAPAPLAEAARGLDRETCQAAMDAYLVGGDTASLRSFFARILLQAVKFGDPVRADSSSATCPCCAHLPQAGVLKELAHGQALWLSCSLCFHQWEYPRGRCVACSEASAQSLSFHRAEEIPHIQVMTCDECRQYLHLIDSQKEPRAVPDIDEVAALPLDVWAIERGFSKLQPNLAGI